MSEIAFLDLIKDTIWLILILSAPVLIVAMTVGVLISLVQAVTQIQEATLTFVPKILASLLTLVVISPWMLHIYVESTQKLLKKMTVIIEHDGERGG